MVGKTILHYKIIEKIGEGGMGVVYKAEDTKLERTVAIKFLPRQIAVNSEEQERFKIEAKAAASLNHPNIATIHAIEEVDDELFIVMEYIEGKELKELTTEDGKLSIEDVTNYAAQIAEGLKAAHEEDVTHRDIKSANIMITDKGQVKIMDFGLAKVRGGAQVTKVGTTLGTAAYMSPEQARGEEADHRSDIWSFGVVLYEMLTGTLPFGGDYEQAVLYSILNEEPESVVSLRPDVPESLEKLVEKTLAKVPAQRYQSMRDVANVSLGERKDFEDQEPHGPSRVATFRESTLPSRQSLVVGIVSLLIIGGLLWYLFLRSPEEMPIADKIITRITSAPGLEDEPTWSPDGKFIAYATDEQENMDIVIKSLAGGSLIRVVDSEADDAQPAWSPDGTKLAFVSARDHGGHLSIALGIGRTQEFVTGKGGDIFLIPALGGTAVKLVDNGYYPSWSPDGKNIVFQSDRSGEWDLWTIPAKGGIPEQLTRDNDFDFHPAWSPDGKWIVYSSGENPFYNLKVIFASGGSPRLLTNEPHFILRPTWSKEGKFVIYSSNRSGSINLWKIPFPSSSEGKLENPQQVTVGQGADQNVSVCHIGNKIAFSTAQVNADIWELTLSTGVTRQVTSETSWEDMPRASPDGKTLLIASDRSGKNALWTVDMQGKMIQQLGNPDDEPNMGSWSPNGKQIAYTQAEEHGNGLYVRTLGSLSPKRVAYNTEDIESPIWSPDGKRIAFHEITNKKTNISIVNLETGDKKQLTDLELSTSFPTWSPDGKYITFHSQRGSIRYLWIIFSQGGTARQITFGNEEHSHPQWSPLDPDVILFVLNHKNLCTVSVATGKIEQMTHYMQSDLILDYPSWSPDGRKIYYSISRKTGDIYTLENY